MSIPSSPNAFARAEHSHAHPSSDTAKAPQRKPPMMRRYEVQALGDDGLVSHTHHVAPATALFEAAFSGFARGTLINTTRGPVAIEDMLPGDEVLTRNGAGEKVMWIGSMSLIPNAPVAAPHLAKLTRIMADTFGLSRPAPDLMVGPGARILHRLGASGQGNSGNETLTHAHAFTDGHSIIEITPPTPVTVYHIALERHAIISAGGLEVESYHPGHRATEGLGTGLMTLFLSLFPHIRDLADFGPLACPRTPITIMDNQTAA